MGDSDVSHGIGDLIQAVVLLHTAGQPLRPFDTFEAAAGGSGRGFAARQTEALGPERKDNWPVPNPEQWQPLRRWASYLGLARTVGREGLIPDASEALLRRLPAMAPGDYDVREFVGAVRVRGAYPGRRCAANRSRPAFRGRSCGAFRRPVHLAAPTRGGRIPDHGPAKRRERPHAPAAARRVRRPYRHHGDLGDHRGQAGWPVSANRVCWSRAAIDFATQVDVGGLEVDDPRADALFGAIHQSLPVRRELSDDQSTEVTEDDVLSAFTRPINSNEPRLLFVKGEKGTGKSHLVRWLKSRLGRAARLARRLHREAQHLAAAGDRADPRRDQHAQGGGAPRRNWPGLPRRSAATRRR